MKQILPLFGAFLFMSCAVSVRVPGNRFQTPETLAPKKVSVGVGRAGMAKVELTSDFTRHYVGERDFALTYSSSAHGSFGVGVHDRVEFGAFYNYESSTSLYGKIKISDNEIGQGHRLIFSGVLSLGLSADSKDEVQTGSLKDEIDLSYFTYDAGLLLGYTLNEDFMLYSGIYYLEMSASGKQIINGVQKDVEATIASPSVVYGFSYKISRIIDFIAEGSYSRVGASAQEDDSFPDRFKRNIHSWGVKFNFH